MGSGHKKLGIRLQNIQFQDAVCERDKNRCMFCMKIYPRQYVCAHHCLTRGAHPERRFDTKIAICVCLGCHRKIHSSKISKEKILERLNQIINEGIIQKK